MKFTFESGPRTGQDVTVEPGRSVVIGRDPAADIFLDDPKVSRPHARIWVDAAGGARIEDMRSTNGTFVNGRRIEEPTPIRGGDAISIGNTRMSVAGGPAAGPATKMASTIAGSRAPSGRESRGTMVVLRESIARANRTSKVAVAIAVALVAVIAIGGGYYLVAGRPLTTGQIVDRMRSSTVYVQVQSQFGSGNGTGWVLDSDRGLIVTNHHVISDITNVTVSGEGLTPRSANVVAASPCDDIAVIHVDDKAGLASVKLGSQGSLKQGDPVLVLGYPVTGSNQRNLVVTEGSVSVVRTTLAGGGDIANLPNVIQTTARINHGNSGGPLITRGVEVVGMNTILIESLDQNYAVGIDRIKEIMGQLAEGHGVGWVGIGLSQPNDTVLGLFQAAGGLLVMGVSPGSEADAQGLRGPALLTSIDGQAITDVPSYCDAVAGEATGQSADFTFRFLGETAITEDSYRLVFR
jgi:S1-C subfamily serine protease